MATTDKLTVKYPDRIRIIDDEANYMRIEIGDDDLAVLTAAVLTDGDDECSVSLDVGDATRLRDWLAAYIVASTTVPAK